MLVPIVGARQDGAPLVPDDLGDEAGVPAISADGATLQDISVRTERTRRIDRFWGVLSIVSIVRARWRRGDLSGF
jgi:hypothetical protein